MHRVAADAPSELVSSENEKISTDGHNGRVYIETVGCQMNMLDSELVVATLRRNGYDITSTIQDADTILFNTCSVREHAEHKIYSQLGRLKFAHRQRPQRVIGVLGCMAQKDQELIFERAPHVDFIVGTGQLGEVSRLVGEAREHRLQQKKAYRALAVGLGRHEGSRLEISNSFQLYDPLRDPEMRPSPYQAFVRIMIGCDKFCSYCVVPTTRGPEQSRPPLEIAAEVRLLVSQGVREVTLLGQTVNSYKYTHDGTLYRLSDLLGLIHDTPGLLRVKFVTNYPKDMTPDLLDAIRDLPKVARYLHVPLQSGCDEMLRKMKRGYTVEEYRKMMHLIRERLPDCAVSSDFIVGFCGETETSHQLSLDAVREFRFKNSFIFKYSTRSGTKADDMFADDIPDAIKRQRNNEMLAIQNEISEEDNAEYIGRQMQVLVEGPSKAAIKSGRRTEDETDDGAGNRLAQQFVGRTTCDRIVVFDANPRLAGSLVDVEILDCSATTLIGQIVTRQVQHGSSSMLPILG
ncbi:MAG: tRNA (N6-isopentenyl adenosine(37)-C2)-methylthiotransferase MiaB [Planctomycetota bacterium]|nr:tRNA (N6-isopentenyl adenosine(37)-C2)-methylthiotransferase MiaB [Planctomycetota bacterium]